MGFESLGDNVLFVPFEVLYFLKKSSERLGIIPGFIHVLDAEKIRL